MVRRMVSCMSLVCALCSPLLSADVENLAPRAKITADSAYSDKYAAQFVADGKIPAAGSRQDPGRAWAVNGKTHGGGAVLTLRWKKPVRVAEVVYYGRTAWYLNECWKRCAVFAGGADTPAATATLAAVHGPQRIPLKQPVTTAEITMTFTASHGGFNPGAAEIQVFPSSPSDEQLEHYCPSPPGQPKESPALAEKVRSGDLGFTKIVVIKRHVINPSHVYTYHAESLKPGGGLYVVDLAAGGDTKQIVDSEKGEILDGNISFDGRRMLFSWKRTMTEPFQVYRINVDGTGLARVTDDDSNNFNCCWLPDGGIAFLSDRKPAFAYCWVTSTPILYRCDRDGENLVRLSANYLNDFTPSVMEDGRILYSRWEYVDKPAIPIQSLWTINQDGTGLSGFFGNRALGPATFMEARDIPGSDGKVLCVLTSHNGPCRGGIGIVDPSAGANAQEAITNLTPEVDIGRVDRGNGNRVRGPYESPFPLDEKYFLVSKAGTIMLRDYDGTAQVTLLDKTGPMGWYTARPVTARQRPRVQESVVEPGGQWASLLMNDVYNGLKGFVERGEIERIAVVQEIEKSTRANVRVRAFGFQFPVVSCGATYAPKRVWGYADIAADGSAHFTVPAGLPIYFIALDKHGRGLQRMRTFTHLMPGERQSCVGCHAERNYAAPFSGDRRPSAARKPPQDLEKPAWGVTGFSYSRIVQPVLDARCAKCHHPRKTCGGVDLSADRTDFFCVSYETLARAGTAAENFTMGGCSPGRFGKSPYTSWIPTYNGLESNILQIDPKFWGSPASTLADMLLKGHPDEKGNPRVKLTANERFRIFQWIDLNVPYYGTSASNYNNTLKGCRRIYPKALDGVLKEVAQRRCASCHKKGVPRRFYTRITNVENNAFLLAPLAKAAGGTEACGKAVFALKDDPDYKKILATFEPVAAMIAENPRKDMEQ